MRFKPPPSLDSNIGWRVEFRTPDLQLTDYENAAMVILTLMTVNIINYYDLDFIMPISKVDENMSRCEKRDALNNQKFYFKTSCVSSKDGISRNILEENDFKKSSSKTEEAERIEELSMAEIFEGKSSSNFPGLLVLFDRYMKDNAFPKE